MTHSINSATVPPYIRVEVGDGAVHFIPNPKSDRHWQMRYNQSLDQLLNAVMILESFDYLLCDEISQTEAIRRLKLLRKARTNPPNPQDQRAGHPAPMNPVVGQTLPEQKP
jgi:hypothetical protein